MKAAEEMQAEEAVPPQSIVRAKGYSGNAGSRYLLGAFEPKSIDHLCFPSQNAACSFGSGCSLLISLALRPFASTSGMHSMQCFLHLRPGEGSFSGPASLVL